MIWKWLLCATLLGGTALNSRAAQAMIAAPVTRIFTNESQQVALKIVPAPDMKATATLTRLGTEGNDQILWTKPLPNLPGRVFISNDWNPYVVTTDSWGNAGGAHAIVVYNPQGEVVADIKGESFLPAPPAPKAGEFAPVMMDGGGRNWSMNTEISFEPRWTAETLVVQFYEGTPVSVALKGADGTYTGALRKLGSQLRISLKTGALTQLTAAQLAAAPATATKPNPIPVAPVPSN